MGSFMGTPMQNPAPVPPKRIYGMFKHCTSLIMCYLELGQVIFEDRQTGQFFGVGLSELPIELPSGNRERPPSPTELSQLDEYHDRCRWREESARLNGLQYHHSIVLSSHSEPAADWPAHWCIGHSFTAVELFDLFVELIHHPEGRWRCFFFPQRSYYWEMEKEMTQEQKDLDSWQEYERILTTLHRYSVPFEIE